ncbi:MAG: hypothetical protein KDI69_09455, partial [Xanthomonadales bacterium]|nr:hypothetical protein [Xanthomonadales bacterium]
MAFEVRGRGSSWGINKKGDKEYRKLKTFADSKEALAYIKSNHADLVAEWENVKDRDNVKESDTRGDENRPRSAQDYRGGKDVTEEQFAAAFGFRGVQFGNWVGQGEGRKARQGMLNEAYDALMDLAGIVKVPPKAISLNGTIGLAFGARGSGKFAAHYEPGNLVINLTKTRGAGSLGHEWFHALDNYFSRQRGGEIPMKRGMSQQDYRQANYITYRPEPMYVPKIGSASSPLTKAQLDEYGKGARPGGFYDPAKWHIDPNHPQGVRPEVERAFAELVERLNESPMKARAAQIDKSPNGYWSQIIERGARSFENFIISKMMQDGYHNDYLANVRAVEDFPRSKNRYPYLLPEEVAPVAEAFQNLFDTIQTKEDDAGNVAIFEPTAPYETDLFGQPLPQAAGSASPAKPAGAGVRGNAQPATAVQDTPATPGEYFTNTIVGSPVSREIGAARVTTPEQAAQATQYLYKSAVERLDGIVTDKTGKVLAVVGGFKGALSQASVYPSTIVGEAVRVPGAAYIWFSHNHPSGTSTLSRADEHLNQSLADVFRGSGIEPKGLMAVTGDKFSYVGVNPMDPTISGRLINKAVVRVKVPVIERELSEGKPGVSISSPAHAKLVAKSFYDRANAPGILLLNAQNEVSAWIPIPKDMTGPLRDTGQLRAIYRAVSQANAGAAIIVHGGELSHQSLPSRYPTVTPAENIGAALGKVDVRVLDIIDATTNRSAAERGEDLSKGPVYARNGGAGVNMQDAKAIVAAVREALPTAPPIHILESINKAPKELK